MPKIEYFQGVKWVFSYLRSFKVVHIYIMLHNLKFMWLNELKVESDTRIAGVREEESKRRNSAAALRARLPLVVAAPCKLRMDLIALHGCPLRGCPLRGCPATWDRGGRFRGSLPLR